MLPGILLPFTAAAAGSLVIAANRPHQENNALLCFTAAEYPHANKHAALFGIHFFY